MRRGLVFRGSATPDPKGAGPQHSPISGVLLYLWLHSLKKNDQIGVGNTCWNGFVFGGHGQPRQPSQGSVALEDPNFLDSLLLMRTWLDLEQPKFDVVTQMGRGCFTRSATPLHLHKSVERFVSERWVSCTGANDNGAGATWRVKCQSNRHHQQNNTQLLTGRMPFLSPNQQRQSSGGKGPKKGD